MKFAQEKNPVRDCIRAGFPNHPDTLKHRTMSSLTMPSAASDPAQAPPAAPVDLSDLERHLRSRLALSWSCLELTEGDPSATAATLNSARLEMAELKREVRSTREEIHRWREQLKKVI